MQPTPHPDQEPLDLDKGLESFVAGTRSQAEELLRMTRSLPEVDKNGNSECPFARELYAKKEKAEQELIGRLATLHRYLSAVEQELARCKGNLVVISSRETMLNRDEAKRMYSDAEVAQAAEYKRYVEKRNRIQETLELVEQALAEERTRQFPGGAGQEIPGMGPPPGVPPTGPASVGEELEHLLALGPVGRKAFNSAV